MSNMDSRPKPDPAYPRPGVQKIAQLVDGRTDASLDDIEKIINNDAAVTDRLMARAYPRAPARETATIQMATSRVGINYVIVLYITDLLKQYVKETFESMTSIALGLDDPELMPLEERDYLVSTVQFKGKATGNFSLVFSSATSLLVADRLLQEGVELNLETINEAVSEITKAIATKLEAGLNAGRLPCKVEPPVVGQKNSFSEGKIPGSSNEEFYFRHGSHGLRVHLCVNPFSLS